MRDCVLDHQAIRQLAFWIDRARLHQDRPEPGPMLQVTDKALAELLQYRVRLVDQLEDK